ncbi:MAG: translation elongation factor 2-like protein [Amphiamblys sp. WSBS2006]|nr:MAG: translation elongation factor 2-like protein [Amphiamblys sp. WSBS2006]
MGGCPEKKWNVCVVAHVDHGKTTLTDNILADRRIISQRSAGMRYLDSRSDEQEKGITVESSVATLPMEDGCVLNIADSPGHVDFSGEVSSVSQLCDGCVVVVDVVEGICAQTRTVLRQTVREGLKPVLVLNKMDKLADILGLDTTKTYSHLSKLIGELNAFYAAICQASECWFYRDGFFSPEAGTVVFASAIDGWGFTLGSVGADIERRLGCKTEKFLWGEYYYCSSAKRVFKKKEAERRGLTKNMFSQFVLDGIWKVYAEKKEVAQRILSAWHPLGRTLIETIKEVLPCAAEGNTRRMGALVKERVGGEAVAYCSQKSFNRTRECIQGCFGKDTAQNGVLLSIGRVLSGAISAGETLTALTDRGQERVVVGQLFFLLGTETRKASRVCEGDVFGLFTEEKIGARESILCADPENIKHVFSVREEPPVMSVVVEPKNLADHQKVVEGLALLCCADSSAEYEVTGQGDILLRVCGEVHLEKCVKDLEECFAQVAVSVSEPIVPFRETIEEEGVVVASVSRDGFTVTGGCVSVSSATVSDDAVVVGGKEYAVLCYFQENVFCGEKEIIDEFASSKGIFISGMKHAAKAGVLSGEPVHGVCFILLGLEHTGSVSAREIGLVRNVFRGAMEKSVRRLLFAFYRCEIRTVQENSGKIYGILSKRKGRVLGDEYAAIFGDVTIHAEVPVINCFGITNEIRVRCKGEAVFSFSFIGFKTVCVSAVEEEHIALLRKQKGLGG